MLLMGMGRVRDIQQEACRVMNDKGSDCAEESEGKDAWEMSQVKPVHEMQAVCPVVAWKVSPLLWKRGWQVEEVEARCGWQVLQKPKEWMH